MAQVLTPLFAANLASDVYQATTAPGRKGFVDLYGDDLDLGESSMISGVTGGHVFSKPHVMGVFAAGKEKTYKGQAFVAFKGTASLYDALTDINVGVRSSHTGHAVHQGFYYAFDSVRQDLMRFVSGLKGVTTLHCVGHSLGGAIATLAADYIRHAGTVSTVRLYTFGSPRIGQDMFVAKCTERVRSENMYRVYHKTDPVPMVPTWPFMHVPDCDADYLIDSPVSAVPWEYHFMEHYIDSVEQAKSWESILTNRPKNYTRAAIEAWLQSDDIASFTARTLDLMNAALFFVVEQAMHATGIVLVSAASGGFTLLDRIAMFMAKAAKVSKEAKGWIFHLVKKLASLINVVVKVGESLTVEFIRLVFLRVHHRIAEMIRSIGRTLT